MSPGCHTAENGVDQVLHVRVGKFDVLIGHEQPMVDRPVERVENQIGVESFPDFLAPNASLALLVGSRDNGLKIRSKLEALGFRIEAGVRCTSGLVLSAHRQGYEQMAKVA